MLKNEFYKVDQGAGTYIVATFFNPTTGESYRKCVRDYDYADCSRDNDELYYMPINEEARRAYRHSLGHILEGDEVEVVKGLKVKIGTTGTVKRIRAVYDHYGRWVADYAVLEDGQSTNITNCKLTKMLA